MHLRRALLLFAIVLGLAAVAASVSRPRDSADETTQSTTPSATVPPEAGSPEPAELIFSVANPRAQRIEAGQAATVLVQVDEAGQASIPDLGLTAAAEPVTPARFEVLTYASGRHPVVFEPAGEDERLTAGTLVVAGPAR